MSLKNNHYPCSAISNDLSSSLWRSIGAGLNIEGLCSNRHCPANKNMVVINLGFGEFDFSRIVLERKNQCPSCGTRVHPIVYGFNKCQWWYVDHYSTRSFSLNTVDDTYELNDLKCEYQVVETRPLSTGIRIFKQEQVAILSSGHSAGNKNRRHQLLQSNQRTTQKYPMRRIVTNERFG